MTFNALKKNYIEGLLETNAFLVKPITEEPFTLRSGRKSYMFLDHSRVATSAKAYRAFIDVMGELVNEVYGQEHIILCNVDSKISAQMVGAIAYLQNKPQIIYKSSALTAIEKGTAMQMTGDKTLHHPVAILDDVMTGGDGTAKKVADLIQETFPKLTDIRIFVGFTRDIKKSTYLSYHVLTRNELIGTVWDKLTAEQQQAIEKEINAEEPMKPGK